ncbi:breast carcinoma-amplified sequence 1 isoform X3 [Rana temporaria]|uniref:breast carcinoma-amplified sequence 1 isoform X3 n=1 Tax=Rana temporaria TaxID=8407 RepID=UPI001AACF59A|nr:breast carcinoma-amplified sequence 1 isoform X3 [Rana temporaria]
MGNELSTFDVEEDQEESTEDLKPQVGIEVQNGPVTLQSSPIINTAPPNTRDNNKANTPQENIIASSQKTIIISPMVNGTDAKPLAPPAKSKFRLTISRPAPGLTTFQPNGPENGVDVKSEVGGDPVLIQTQNNAPIPAETNVTKGTVGGGPNLAPPTVLATDDAPLSETNSVEVESTPSKPREVSIFHRLFKPEKKVQFEEPGQAEGPENQEVVITLNQNGGLQSVPPSASLQSQNVDKGNQAAVDGQSSEPAGVPVGPETSTEATQTSPQPEIHPVMSFFKTLVNKPGLKSEEESKSDVEDKKKKENGGLRKSSSKKEKGKAATLQAPEKEMKAQKKAESSKSSTLGRLFRPKPKKDEVQAGGDKVVVEQPVVSANSEQSAPEQVIPQDAKPSNVPPQITAAADDGKGAKESPARPRLFWRKSFKGDPPPSKIQENGMEEMAAVSVNAAPEPTLTLDTNPPEVAVQPQEEEKAVQEAPPRPLPFWRKSFKVDPLPPKVQENIAVELPAVSIGIEQQAPEQPAPEQPAVPETTPAEGDKPSLDSEKPLKEATPRPVPFWRKSFKGEPQPVKVQESVAVEQPVVSVSLNTEKSAPEQIVAPDVQADAVIAPPENEKPPVKEVAPRNVPFWRKSFKAEPPPPKVPENSPPEEPVTIQLTETSSAEPDSQSAKADSGAKTSPVTEGKSQQGKKADEGKNSKPKIMMFFKQLTLDITDGVEVGKSEKTVVTAVVEPPPAPPLQKSKENSKEKKASSEKLTKQESRESPEAAAASSQAQVIEAAPVLNGAESSKEGQMKRVEKRQSLGSFFKAIGPKRLCDAEVQTDPVSILPAEKAK